MAGASQPLARTSRSAAAWPAWAISVSAGGGEAVVQDGEEGAGRDGDLGDGCPLARAAAPLEAQPLPGLRQDGASELVDRGVGGGVGQGGPGVAHIEAESGGKNVVELERGGGAVAVVAVVAVLRKG
jgi:hypothetical protein